eukprot:TRINITY_DN71064_c2_g1_i1.p1 TRINITY_DN71064_c2_g1~~TRINITY_DN71064_c2_g1_i1.p1  ORF type:complete len:4083 (+),score=665.19 TRINITY_DN71064_c2_g1_i1:2435-14683(+)
MVPFAVAPGRLPRSIVVEKTNKLYQSFVIEALLDEIGVEWRNPKLAPGSWLPIEGFDNADFECRLPEEWVELVKESGGKPLKGRALCKDPTKDGMYIWRPVKITGYNKLKQLFEIVLDNSTTACIHRVKLYIEGEDPRVFANRFAGAYYRRAYADSLIRYNYYIENMPTDEIPELSNEQIAKVITQALTARSFKGKSQLDTQPLINEVNADFAKTMNKIIFDKHMRGKGRELIGGSLMLPPEPRPKRKYYGMISIPAHNFPETFASFGFESILMRQEAIKAGEKINLECLEAQEKEIFNTNFTKTLKLEEFKQIESSSISQCAHYLRETWVSKIKDIVKEKFKDSGDWCNLNETLLEAYNRGKLKKFLTLIRIKMQETVKYLFEKSFKKYVDTLVRFVPRECKVISPSSVDNVYSKFQLDELERPPFPLFTVELSAIGKPEEMPIFSQDPKKLVDIAVFLFDKAVDDLQQIAQVEPKVMPHFFKTVLKVDLRVPFRPQKRIANPTKLDRVAGTKFDQKELEENGWLDEYYEKLRTELTNAVKPLETYRALFKQYREEFALDIDEEKKKLEDTENPMSSQELKRYINKHKDMEKLLQNEIPKRIQVSIFQIDCKEMRKKLAEKHAELAREAKLVLKERAKAYAAGIAEAFDVMKSKIRKIPTSIEDLTDIRTYIASEIPGLVERQKLDIEKMIETYDIMDEYMEKLPREEFNNKWSAFRMPKELMSLIEDQKTILSKKEESLFASMQGQQAEFKEDLSKIEDVVANLKNYTDISQYEEVSKKTHGLREKLKEYKEKEKTFNHRESLLNKITTDYGQLKQIEKEFIPYDNLWSTTDKWFKSKHSWHNDEWEKLDAQAMENIVNDSGRLLSQTIRAFKEMPAILKIAEQVKDEVEKFRKYVPLALALRTEGMKDRHWDEISTLLGFEVRPKEGFTMTNVINMNLIDQLQEIEKVGEKAAKEYAIEMNLYNMKKAWEKVEFKLISWKTSGTSIVAQISFEDINALIDEHMVLTQQMMSSCNLFCVRQRVVFKGIFATDIEEWNKTLMRMSNILEAWVALQKMWLALQPIFESPTIAKELPSETREFKKHDTTWREIMGKVKHDPVVLRECQEPELLERFQHANSELEKVKKSLEDYLEKKRQLFARFYFLADEELFEIMSQSKDIESIRPYLKRVFESIVDIEYKKAERLITTMISAEDERVEFTPQIDTSNKPIEFWMGDMEKSMRDSVHRVLKKSFLDYSATPRTAWCLQHPGQVVLTTSQIHWTKEVEGALEKAGSSGVKDYFGFLERQLLDTVELVRTKLSKMQTITLNALIVVDVHAKDVVERLYKAGIEDKNAFEWISQLRFYWENDNCLVKCIQTEFPYGYEYLGNSGRLVITPLTDKCYITLMGALKLNKGGAPAGPAGTGKTETTKDLAKSLAKQCVVFNCSENMETDLLARFFKGLAASGAWACYDEFNRISIEVLSVIAQLLKQLFEAKEHGEEDIVFCNSSIRLNNTFCVFITMNPGYAGRTELPDNLKALFRPVAMMVPDYKLIAEIKLYSFGFKYARDLARKIVVTFTLCSEQLSYQPHYDYGMRAVSAVINASGLLKFENMKMNEDQLILRAIRDVNAPKFLKDDLPLFENIIKDLFPKVERPKVDYGSLQDAIFKACDFYKLQPIDKFIDKIIQLYDTTQVRHGLMIVGPAGGGKTCNYKVLARAITSLKGQDKFSRVHYHIINPKSIKYGQLYGTNNPLTGEWVDGVLAIQVQQAANDPSPDRHWMLFDGPVDTLWIESMNSVLDDSKKLCLNSGQVIKLTDRMTMMFEVDDLSQASPATVSRCGMVYMDPANLGLQPIFKSWQILIPEKLRTKKSFMNKVNHLFDHYVEPTIYFLRKNLKELVATTDINLFVSLLKIMDTFLAPYFEEGRKLSPDEIEEVEKEYENIFIFSFIWSICCTTTLEGRIRLNLFVKDLLQKGKAVFPEEGTIYDYRYTLKEKKWQHWLEGVPPLDVDSRVEYADVVVPTMDSIRMKHVIKELLCGNRPVAEETAQSISQIINNKSVLTPGPTGTGKTVNITELLSKGMEKCYQWFGITFSAQTSENQTQDALDTKLEKRRAKVYGPQIGNKFVVFVDDLNMPKKEIYGTQPPLELLRQYMDHQGWYEYNKEGKPFRRLVDVIFVAAMGPPGGGRSAITQRLQRHFNILTYSEMDNDTIKSIFQTILGIFIAKGKFPEPVVEANEKIIESILKVYASVKERLKPTPDKSHYTFNMRDISKTIQGICSAHPPATQDALSILRLWWHENTRVFADRLTTAADRAMLSDLLKSQAEETFGVKSEDLFNAERIIFGDYMQGESDRIYVQITNMKQLVERVERYLEDYNSENKPMRLVMFLDACDHVSRICRILRQPQGNALLLGVGGSGRQSLAKLASYISMYKCSQIEVAKGFNMNNWRDFLRNLLITAGEENRQMVFLFSDTQIIQEQMLEDINNILNSGDVPALYKPEDMERITKIGDIECTRKKIDKTNMNKFTQYLLRVRKNIHIVLAMSPVGEAFRNRLRQFPSLVNCCTIDWFTEWPDEALLGVAKGAMQDADLNLGDKLQPVVEMFKTMHQSVERKSKVFYEQLRRRNYLTPTSYLAVLNLYKFVLNEQRQMLGNEIRRKDNGVKKLVEANKAVMKLQEDLIEKQPQLELTQKELEEKTKDLAIEYDQAEEARKNMAVQEADAKESEEIATKLSNEAEAEVKKVGPMLEKAEKQLKGLDESAFVELRRMVVISEKKKPFIEAMLIMYGAKLKKPTDPAQLANDPQGLLATMKKVVENARELKAELCDYKTFMGKLSEAEMNQRIIKLEPILSNKEKWTEDEAAGASQALKAFYFWVNAMVSLSRVEKIAKPLRTKAQALNQKKMEARKILEEKRKQLKIIDDKIADLEIGKKRLVEREAELKKEINECKRQLENASKLVKGLESEKTRWESEVLNLKEQSEYLIGDCLVSAGMLAYAGPFTSDYRQELESAWVTELDKQKIIHSPNLCMRNVLGNPAVIREWVNKFSLPDDNLSVENAIILENLRRWPLIIDPQNQASIYIKARGSEKASNLIVHKATDTNILRSIETAIDLGKWVLIENVTEKLDPTLENVLQMGRMKSGTNVKIGARQVKYDDQFKLYITTRLPNPHYSPETSVMVTLLNFAITFKGLEEQMLNQFIDRELPEQQQKKNEILRENAEAGIELMNIEKNILMSLQKYEQIAEILYDEKLIEVLASAKKKSAEIKQRLKESEITEKEIDSKRENYRAIAKRASLLFFCVMDVSQIDPMYQYSLRWFKDMFYIAIQQSKQAEQANERVGYVNSEFTHLLYENVCRGLFEKHKMLFSFLLTTKILFGDDKIDPAEWRYFLAGPTGDVEIPARSEEFMWIPEKEWPDKYRQLCGMDTLERMKGVKDAFMKQPKEFQKMYDSQNAHDEPLPGDLDTKLDDFQKMIVLKMLRPDKITDAMQKYIVNHLGKEFIEPPTLELHKCFNDSTTKTPLIFILTQGTDPLAQFLDFAKEMNRPKDYISLGKGNEKAAAALLDQAKQNGGWVLLQNCHLAVSWMPQLELIVENISDTVHKDFRLWLSSFVCDKFPVSVLQNSVKMTVEPPLGIKANLKLTYTTFKEDDLTHSKKPEIYKKLLFGFCFFHAVVQDRRKFGPIGWNITYEFNTEDLKVCIAQLKILLNDYEEVPYKVLNFLGAEINYGGRVTDDKDSRLIKTIMADYMNSNVLKDDYKFSSSGIYYSPLAGTRKDYLKYIKKLPRFSHPEVFGMHENAAIITAQAETRDILETILNSQPRSSAGAKEQERDTMILNVAKTIESKIPPPFDLEQIAKQYPTLYEESMNTVLMQEVVRYNGLLIEMQSSLQELQLALAGAVVMSEDIEAMRNSIFNNTVPRIWSQKGFLSLKPLSSWLIDLTDRIKFMQGWIEHGTPVCFWISGKKKVYQQTIGFFFPQAFLTGTKQNYARTHTIAIDKLAFEFIIMDDKKPEDIKEKPKDGCYVYGMLLEGARWNYDTHLLDDSLPKELYTDVPLIWFLPKDASKDEGNVKEVILQCVQCNYVGCVQLSSVQGAHSTGNAIDYRTLYELCAVC